MNMKKSMRHKIQFQIKFTIRPEHLKTMPIRFVDIEHDVMVGEIESPSIFPKNK